MTYVSLRRETPAQITEVSKRAEVGGDFGPSSGSDLARAMFGDVLVDELVKSYTMRGAGTNEGTGDTLLPAPFDLYRVARLVRESSAIAKCISALVTNVVSFGYELAPRISQEDHLVEESAKEPLQKAQERERAIAADFFDDLSNENSFVEFRKQLYEDRETFGRWWVEVLRDESGTIRQLERMAPHQMRMTALSEQPMLYTVKKRRPQPDGSVKTRIVGRQKRFRKFCQIDQSSLAGLGTIRYVWFREYGCPIHMDYRDGRYESDTYKVPPEFRATEILSVGLRTNDNPYGLPRFYPALEKIKGVICADKANVATISTNNLPSGIVTVRGEMSAASAKRLERLLEASTGANRARGALAIIEGGNTAQDSTASLELDFLSLDRNQITDAMFLQFLEYAANDLYELYRIPKLYFGSGADYARNVADEIRRNTDVQVFQPERMEEDRTWTRLLEEGTGVSHIAFVTQPPVVTDPSMAASILATVEKAGGATPRIAREMLARMFPWIRHTPAIDSAGLDPDQPFSFQLAEAMKKQSDPSVTAQTIGPVHPSADETESLTKALEEWIGHAAAKYAGP